ncbi:MAG: TonB-dependent receptor [Pirellulaceae bacterium]
MRRLLHTITDTIGKKVKLAVITLCILLMQVTFLSAQDTPDDEPVTPSPSDIPTLPETTVQGVIPFPHDPLRIWLDNGLDAQGDPLFSNGQRFNQSILRSPSHRSIIDLRELLERSPVDMYQAIEREAGVLVQRTQRGAASPFIRGLTGQQVVILVDGIRMNNATFRSGPNQYFNTIDPGMVDHIEVIRGPQTVLYGSDAMGGVINVITRQTGLGSTPNGPIKTWTNRYSSADNAFYTRMNYQYHNGKTGIFLGSGYANVNNLDRGGNLGRQPATDYSQYSGDVRIDRIIADNQTLTFSLQHFVQEDLFRSDRFPSRRTIFDPQQRSMMYLRMQGHEMNNFFDQYSLTFSYHRQREQVKDRRLSQPYFEESETDNNTFGFSLLLGTDLADQSHLTYGVDMYNDVVDSFKNRFDATTGNFLSARNPTYPDDGWSRQTGAFVQYDKQLNDHLGVTAGTRFTRSHVQATPILKVDDDGDPLTDPVDTPVHISPSFDNWSASGGLAYQLNADLMLVGSISEGFRAPNLDDLASNNDNVQQAAADTPSIDLLPETSLSYEVALRKETDDLRWQATTYWMDIDNMILRTPAGSDGTSILFSRSNRDSKINGFEFYAEKRVDENWTLYGNFSYILGQDQVLNEPLSRIPPTQGIMGLRWRNSEKYEYLDFYAWVVRRQDRLNFQDISDNRIPNGGTSGYATFNIRYGTMLSDTQRITVELENILDQAYRVHGSGVDGAGFSANIQYSFEF